LKTLFRFYSLNGTVGNDDVKSCGQGQFLNYAAEIQVMDKTSMDLNAGTINQIFIRANQDRSEGVDIFDRQNMGAALKNKKGARGSGAIDNEMELVSWLRTNDECSHCLTHVIADRCRKSSCAGICVWRMQNIGSCRLWPIDGSGYSQKTLK
jgi:hypothetical protein